MTDAWRDLMPWCEWCGCYHHPSARHITKEGQKTPPTWSMPRYPGDAVRIVEMVRGDEHGDVRIQIYEGAKSEALVAVYLPWQTVELPGDTPKMVAQEHQWCDRAAADGYFDFFIEQAQRGGWEIKP